MPMRACRRGNVGVMLGRPSSLDSGAERLERSTNLSRGWDQTAHSTVEGYGATSLDCQPNVLDHLAGRQLHGQDAVQPLAEPGQLTFGEWPERDRPEEANANALLASLGNRTASDAGSRAVGHDRKLGIIQLPPFPADLTAGDLAVLVLQGQVSLLEHLWHQVYRLDDPSRPTGCARQRPIEGVAFGRAESQLDRTPRLRL